MTNRTSGHLYGTHRVLEPASGLPQSAQRLDASGPAFDNEVVIDVETLNIDSASFHQIMGEVGREPAAIAGRVREIVAERGKMQNPVTGSGGMLLGTVRAMGENYVPPVPMKVGDRIATLVSLSLTPLSLEEITAVHVTSDQVDVRGTAYLWPSSPIVVLPEDMDARLALAVLDVCGAPAQTLRLVEGQRTVVVLGAGKSGMLCAAAARDALGADGRIFALDLRDDNMVVLKDAGIIDDYRCVNAKNPVEVLDRVLEMTGGELVDVMINTCNVEGVEMSSILPVRSRGKVYYFNMATSFSRAALGSEGVGKDVDLLIGNGYAEDHAELALDMVRKFPVVRRQIEALMEHE